MFFRKEKEQSDPKKQKAFNEAVQCVEKRMELGDTSFPTSECERQINRFLELEKELEINRYPELEKDKEQCRDTDKNTMRRTP